MHTMYSHMHIHNWLVIILYTGAAQNLIVSPIAQTPSIYELQTNLGLTLSQALALAQLPAGSTITACIIDDYLHSQWHWHHQSTQLTPELTSLWLSCTAVEQSALGVELSIPST